jgi:hypothetical protein
MSAKKNLRGKKIGLRCWPRNVRILGCDFSKQPVYCVDFIQLAETELREKGLTNVHMGADITVLLTILHGFLVYGSLFLSLVTS